MNISTLLRTTQSSSVVSRSLNCWTAAIGSRGRSLYERTYPTTVVMPDGSSLSIQYHEPRSIIVLPVDPKNYFFTKHSLKPKVSTKTVYKEDTVKTNFNRRKYL